MTEFIIWINNKEYRETKVDTEQTLLHYVRSKGLTGTKLGCGEGGCGACTVVVGTYQPGSPEARYMAVNACLMPMLAAHEKHVITVEGIGQVNKPHLVQKAMAGDASQCGFCTPGFVMSLYAAWRNGTLKADRVEECLDGNLCRCTGYRPIIEAARKICAMGPACCQFKNKDQKEKSSNDDAKGELAATQEDKDLVQDFEKGCKIDSRVGLDPTQEIIFPARLKQYLDQTRRELIFFTDDRTKWYRPTTFEQMVALKADHPEAKIVFGNTEVGVEIKFKNMHFPVLIYAGDVTDIDHVSLGDSFIEFGCGVRLTRLKAICEELMEKEHKYSGLGALWEMLRWFAGGQIRNVSCWTGNMATASPISDLNPVWAALGATLLLESKRGGQRRVLVSEFFLGYRKTALAQDEVIRSIIVPLTGEDELVKAYKQSKRRDDDITIVNAAFRLKTREARVEDIHMSFGGMGAITLVSRIAREGIIGKSLDDPTFLDQCLEALKQEFTLPLDAVGGMPEYRNSLLLSIFFKFYMFVIQRKGLSHRDEAKFLSPSEEERQHHSTKGSQYFTQVPQEDCDLTGQPIAHLSALKHSTGNAQYVDDLPRLKDELYAGLVLSLKAHAKIVNVDWSEAEKVYKIIDVVVASDVKGTNNVGPVFQDEYILAPGRVTSCGQIVAIVLAEDQLTAQRAARMVKVTYEDLKPILTIDEAIKENSFHSPVRKLEKGNVEEAMAMADVVVEGESNLGGQEHFYLETQAALAIPRAEDDTMEIISSTQNPTEGQHFVAKVLGIPAHKVVCRVKRIGGGFGGKETRSSFLLGALAIAAKKQQRPVRCMLDRDEDMIFSGQRHPFKMSYRLGMMRDGKIRAADLQIWSNGGHSLDLSLGVLEKALSHLDNCYNFPNFRVIGRICKTNMPSNTAFRGFGGPQGNFFCETLLTHAAQALNIGGEEMRRKNLYRNGDLTPFGMVMEACPLERMWEQLLRQCNFFQRQNQVHEYNRNHRWKKRGLSILPTKFGIAFGVRFLNQAGALVHVYSDGSVLLTHGGVEMGQGLHTKMCQIAADALGVPLETVHFEETSTATIPNTSPSAASASSDLNGMAVLRACRQITERLKPIREMIPEASFAELAQAAYRERIDLSARGFYATPEIGFDWETGTGRLYGYFTFGVAASEVELDVLTGDHRILRSDIVMDLGRSLNPTVDIGQIEGAFVQGLGLFTIEQPLYLRSGMMLNRGPGGYKIPTASDIPEELNVTLLEESHNREAIYGSKAVGEPPLFLSASVFFALHQALLSARGDAAREALEEQRPFDSAPLILDSPATVERLRLAAGDRFVSPDGKHVNPRNNEQAWCIEV